MSQNRYTASEDYPIWILYLFGFVLIVIPLSDVMIAFVPLNLASVQWRVGMVGLLSGAMLWPLIGLSVALLAAHLRESKWLRRILEAICFIAGLITALALVFFVLDVIQLRRDVVAERMTTYQLAAAKGALTLILEAVWFIVMSVWSFRRGRAMEKRLAAAAKRTQAAPPIMARATGEATTS